MSNFHPGDFPSGPWDELFARFLGAEGRRQPMQRIDIMRLLTEQARSVVALAAQRAAEGGQGDLDTLHLLWAATRDETTRRLLTGAGAHPDALGRELEPHLGSGPARQDLPALTPAAKRALLDAVEHPDPRRVRP